MNDAQTWFLRIAGRLSYCDFELEVRQWERLADQDSPEPPCRENRNIRFTRTHFDLNTFEEMANRFTGQPARRFDPATYRCETTNGTPVDPTEAFANALVTKIRRVLINSASVVIDLGRARNFTGGARTAAKLNTPHCPWPGCAVPTSACEIDHTLEHEHGGKTNPHGGGPFCGRHNRWKQNGFTVWRDPTGTRHTHRPNSTKIE